MDQQHQQRPTMDNYVDCFVKDLCFWEGTSSVQGMPAAPAELWSRLPATVVSSSSKVVVVHQQQRQQQEQEEEAPPSLSSLPASPDRLTWQPALDPATGKTYYYHTVTLETRWKKPSEIRKWERRRRRQRDKARAQQVFFRDMERNIRNSWHRHQLIPGIPLDQTPSIAHSQGPSLSSSRSSSRSSPPPNNINNKGYKAMETPTATRVRTLSGMDENILANLNDDGDDDASRSSSSSSHCRAVVIPRSQSSTSLRTILTEHSTTTTTTTTKSSLREGRPPRPHHHAPSQRVVVPPTTTTTAGPVVSAASRLYVQDGFVAVSSSGSSDSGTDDEESTASSAVQQARDNAVEPKERKHPTVATNDVVGSGGSSDDAASTQPPSEQPRRRPGHLRHRNTSEGGTAAAAVAATITHPDVAATIQSVCGIYRTHIVQGWERQKLRQYRRRTLEPLLVCLFRDGDHHGKNGNHHHHNNNNNNDNEAPKMVASNSTSIPSLQDIVSFYNAYYLASKMQEDTILLSLIYLERLIKCTNGTLVPTPDNWRSLLFSCMILASKVSDDFSCWNVDFSDISQARGMSHLFSLERINELEVALLTSLKFNVRVSASEYAKYYFLIRAMMTRAGGKFFPSPKKAVPPRRQPPEGAKLSPASQFFGSSHKKQMSDQPGNNNNNGSSTPNNKQRSFSADWNMFSSVLQAIEVPSLSSLVARTSQ